MTVRRPQQVEIRFAADDGPEEFPTQMGERGRLALAATLLVVLAIVVYLPTLRGQFILSDIDKIANNLPLRSWKQGLSAIWLHPSSMPDFAPLTYTFIMAQCKVLGVTRPGGFHAVSILLHALNVLLLWTVLRRLELQGALAAAAIFAVHPALVESIAWLSMQGALLGALLCLSSTICWLRWNDAADVKNRALESSIRRRRGVLALAACATLALALLAEPGFAGVPIALAAITLWKHGTIRRADIVLLVAMALIALVGVTAAGLLSAKSASLQWGGIARQLWQSAARIVLPLGPDFAFASPAPESGRTIQLLGWLAVAALLVAGWALRGRPGRGALAAAGVFVALAIPELLIGARTLYLAPAAIIAGGAALVSPLPGRFPAATAIRAGLAAALVAMLGLLTLWRVPAFESDERFWTAALAADPDSIAALNHLGSIELHRQKSSAAAMGYFTRVLELDPGNRAAQLGAADAYAAAGDANKAMMQYLQILADRPDDADARVGYALSLNALGQSTAALAELHAALQLRPRDARAHLYIGRIHQFHARNDEAEKWYRKAIELDPFDPDAYVELAMLRYYFYQDVKQAEELIVQATRINPRNATPYLNLGVMQFDAARKQADPEAKKRMVEEAALYLGQAALLDPRLAVAFKNRAIALGYRSRLSGNQQERMRFLNQALDAMERAAELGDEEARQAVPSLRADRERSQVQQP